MSEDSYMSGSDGSGDESRKRRRSKFSSEKPGDFSAEPTTQTNNINNINNNHDNHSPKQRNNQQHNYSNKQHPSKKPRREGGNDDFAALLNKHVQSQQRPTNNQQHNKHNKNNKNYTKNKHNNNNNNRKPQGITLKRFSNEFSSPSTDLLILSQHIATFLRENNSTLIHVILSHLGTDQTLAYVRETAQKEEEGGLMTVGENLDKRRRSPGGCFFYLVKEGVDPEMRKNIFTDERAKASKKITRNMLQNKHNKGNKDNNNNSNNNGNNRFRTENNKEDEDDNKENIEENKDGEETGMDTQKENGETTEGQSEVNNNVETTNSSSEPIENTNSM